MMVSLHYALLGVAHLPPETQEEAATYTKATTKALRYASSSLLHFLPPISESVARE
jgi:hypothetical protein